MPDQPTYYAILDATALQNLDTAAIVATVPWWEPLDEVRHFRDACWPNCLIVDLITWEPAPGEEVRHVE